MYDKTKNSRKAIPAVWLVICLFAAIPQIVAVHIRTAFAGAQIVAGAAALPRA